MRFDGVTTLVFQTYGGELLMNQAPRGRSYEYFEFLQPSSGQGYTDPYDPGFFMPEFV